MSANLSVTLIQSDLVWEDTIANLSSFEEKIARLDGSTDVIVLPEMFNSGFTMNTAIAEPMNFTTTRWMKQIAAQTGALVIGSFAVREKDQCYNRCFSVKPDGSISHTDKRHLFTMGSEHVHYAPGAHRELVTWKGWKILPLICYDLRFPVWSRNLVSDPYDLLVYVANWPARRTHAWNTLLRARAIENQAFVVGVNRVGSDSNGLDYHGDSVALDYLGEPLYLLGSEELEKTVSFSKEDLTAYRASFPALRDADNFEIK